MKRVPQLLAVFAVLSLAFVGCSSDTGSLTNETNATAPSLSPDTYAYIGDFVWYDMNCDGIQDAGEPGVEGVEVRLYDCDDNLAGTAYTDATGWYWIQANWDMSYYVMFVLPNGYTFSPKDQGISETVDSDADPSTGKADCTYLEAWEEDPTWDAGLCMDVPQDGCTRTIGYWKNHDGEGPQDDEVSQYLPISLGTAINVTTAAISTAVLEQKTYGKPSNGITKLYAQLLAAKLNQAAGASTSDVSAIIAAADVFLSTYDHNDWKDNLTDDQIDDIMYWHGMLDDYNNGYIGPGHCGDGDGDCDGISKAAK
jgi:hypothetical protein